MKKTLLSIALVATGLVAFAQKPAAGDMTLETQFSLDMGGPNGFSTPEIRYRYFLNEGMAVRGRLNITSTSSTLKIDDGAPSGKKTGEISASQFGFGIAVGAEKHLAGTDKLSPYFGAELAFSMLGGNDTTATGSTNGSSWTGDGDKYETSGGSTTAFGLNLMFGADYYFTDAIYLGGEMGWGFMYRSTSEQTAKATPKGGTPAEGTIAAENSRFDLGMMNFPSAAVRFGVKF